MAAELLDHGEAVDRFLDGMVQQVKPDQTGIEVSVVHYPENAYSLWRILPVTASKFRYI